MIQTILLLIILVLMILLTITATTGLFLRVPFVPSGHAALLALTKFPFKGNEKVVDLGSGSGTVLFFLQQHFPKLHLSGYELAILPYLWSIVKNAIRGKKVSIHYQNFLHADLKQYDILFCYLMPEAVKKVVEKLKRDNHRCLLVTNTFSYPELPVKETITHGKTTLHVYQL